MTTLAARVVLLAAVAAGCTVESTYLRGDWEQIDRHSLKRIVVLVRAPERTPPLFLELAGRIARRYVNLQKGYLVLRNAAARSRGGPPEHEALAGADGALRLDFTRVQVDRTGDEVELAVDARLERRDRTLVWRVVGARSDEAANEDLAQLTERYAHELGPAAAPFVAPTFILLQQVLSGLPSTALTEDDILEKVDLDS